MFLDDHVAEIDPDAKGYAPPFRNVPLAVEHSALDLGSAARSVDNTRKFRQQAVAGVLDDAAPVFPKARIHQLPEVSLEAFVRPLLVRLHQARIARHVSGQDRGETAERRHFSAQRLIALTNPRSKSRWTPAAKRRL